MKVSFQLTMPNNNAWNGKWSGASKDYFRVRTFRKMDKNELLFMFKDGAYKAVFHYDFGDGWMARVVAEKVDSVEANKRLRRSAGFCGYDWMIDSIIKYGQILASKPEPVNS